MQTVKMNQNMVLVKVDEDAKNPKYTPSGLILPPTTESTRPKTLTGTVLSVGEGKRNKKGKKIPMDEQLQVGVRVLFGYYMGSIVEVDGADCRILSDDQLFGVIEE